MDGELLEVRNMDLSPFERIEVSSLRVRQRPLNYSVRNVKASGNGPVGPDPLISQETTEDIYVRRFDHGPIVSCIDTRDRWR